MKTLTAGLALALAAFAVGGPSKSTITKVTSTNVGGGVEIAVLGESLSEPQTFFASGHTLYIVQFKAGLVPSPGRIQVGNAGVNYVRYLRFQSKPAVSRIVLSVGKDTVPVISQEGGTWYVRVGVTAPEAPIKSIDDGAAMQSAVSQLKGTGNPFAEAQAKVDSQIVNPGGRKVQPGDIVGVQTTTGFAQTEVGGKTISAPNVPNPIGSPFKESRVTFIMQQVDVLAAFQAFSRQAHVNIIASPDVSPKDKPILLTMSLQDVELDFAMTAVSSLAGLRFTRIGNTFVVCRAADFNSKVGNIIANSGVRYESRVVELSSGEAKQIRDATIQAIPQDGPDGYYEMLDPTSQEKYGVGAAFNPATTGDQTGGAAATGTGTGTAGDPGAAAANTGASGPTAKRAKYIMLIGEPHRLDTIEAYVRDMDKRISASFSLAGAANFGSVVVPIMSGQTAKIKEMLDKVLAQNPRRSDYSIDETAVKELAEGQESVKMLLIAGPKEELEVLRAFADTLDASLCANAGIKRNTDADAFAQFYEVVDLKYIEPTHAAFDLKNRVRGLYVTILPDPVTPGLKGQDSAKKQETGAGDANGAAAGGGAAANAQAEITRNVGHEQMRLVLRGTKDQILAAKEYLAAVDLPARQVSIEMRVMEITKSEAQRIGIDWSVLSGGRLTSLRMNQGLGQTSDTPGTVTFHYQDNPTSSLDFLGLLDSISNKNNLIAKPNTLVTDGRMSHLFVGDTIRYIKTINASQSGTTVVTDEVQVGVTVDITARVGDGGNIALDLSQKFSILNGFTPVPGGGQIPQTSDRESSMFLNVREGETIALGGLILEQDRKRVSGIPFLKDLPLIGYLFKRTDNSKDKTEVVFFLTAHVVDNTNALTAADPRKQNGGAVANPKTKSGTGN